MISMDRSVNNPGMLEVLGIGLIKITFEEIESEDYSSEVFYQIGIIQT